jgi:GalNAc-alpha-(1->4)-GalNAc-alpha-(1->3)-diNAcBac-PP-undecaprenol alpha-1,4-N-acetyl-D-galactosaminyltransferase
MEKVAVLLANEFCNNGFESHILILSRKDIFFDIDPLVKIHKPNFEPGRHSFFIAAIKSIIYIRGVLKKNNVKNCLSFGDRYNAIFILGALFAGIKITISNRQNPLLSNGKFIDLLNKIFYPLAKSVIAQTQFAKDVFIKKYKHKSVTVIPNPVPQIAKSYYTKQRNKWIINIGRFGDQKNQFDLVNYFTEIIDDGDWKLYFIGDGDKRIKTQQAINRSHKSAKIEILGYIKDTSEYLMKGAIFAFVSRTEGFPNALAEAMAFGMAVISYDCIAGPSELIDDGVNGYLIPEGNEALYKKRLQELMLDEEKRISFGLAAIEKIRQFDKKNISKKYLDVVLNSENSN